MGARETRSARTWHRSEGGLARAFRRLGSPQKPLPARLVAPRPVPPSPASHTAELSLQGAGADTRPSFPGAGSFLQSQGPCQLWGHRPLAGLPAVLPPDREGGREWGCLDADLRFVRAAAPGSRAPFCIQARSCVSGFPTARPGRTLRPPGRGGSGRGPGRSPGAGGVPAPRGHGPRGAPSPTHVEDPSPPPRGQRPRPSPGSRLAPPNRLPQRPLPLSGPLVQTNGIAWAVRSLANR